MLLVFGEHPKKDMHVKQNETKYTFLAFVWIRLAISPPLLVLNLNNAHCCLATAHKFLAKC